MKVVASSCWHFGLKIAGYDCHEDILEAARIVVDATHGADLFVHLGDLFETNRPAPREYAAAMELLNQLGCPAVLIPGNHDPDTLEPFKKIEFTNEVKVQGLPGIVGFTNEIKVQGSPGIVGIENKKFLFVGHVRDKDVRAAGGAQAIVNEAFDEARVVGVDAVFSHLNIPGAAHGLETYDLTMPECATEFPCFVINGHIHTHQRIANIWMPGSLIRVDVSECEEFKGFVEVEI